ncbi:GbsR/MarR family transcriptional regulator [Jiangella alba]|uniref:MarR family protein n=1 Tax=Jiangella alba TaxID=561176 RepID=A0A1H5PXT9_9ACTN|nr:MarR family transcriptional regulator [Jiangella alba]SEF18682.1 MarR family protein [Jiangella alba]
MEMSELSDEVRTFIDRFTDAWELMRGKRMNGRVLALLIITDEPYLSSADLGRLLNTSPGTISTATRALLGSGYITKVSIPNSRATCFRAEDDVWGAFLSREKLGLQRMEEVLRTAMSTPAGAEPAPARRLRNGSRYMAWVDQYHRNVLEQWHTYRDQEEDTPPPQELPAEMLAAITRLDHEENP